MSYSFVKKLDNPRKVYKVVRQDDRHNFHSVGKMTYISTQYRIGKEVRPNVECTPLFTFVSLEAAYAFKSPLHFILECVTWELYGNPLYNVLPLVALENLKPERLYDFWCIPLERAKFSVYKTEPVCMDTILVASLIPERVLTNSTVLEELS